MKNLEMLPTGWGWLRLAVGIVIGIVLLLPSHPGTIRESAGEPTVVLIPAASDKTFGHTPGRIGVAGVFIAGEDERVAERIIVSVPPLRTAMAGVQSFLGITPDEDQTFGDLKNANAVSDHVSWNEALKLQGLAGQGLGEMQTMLNKDSTWVKEGLREGDITLTAGGMPIQLLIFDMEQCGIRTGETTCPVVIYRDGQLLTVNLSTRTEDIDNAGTLGVMVPVNTPPLADTPNSEGSSRGLLVTLAYLDAYTPGDLTGGQSVTGTGTIENDGTVGTISAIEYKVEGALDGGYTVFFAPTSQAPDAERAANGRLTVVPVATAQEALQWLCQHGGESTACPQ